MTSDLDTLCLTDREKKVYNLYFQRGWHIEDIAAELDVSRRTIGRLIASMQDPEKAAAAAAAFSFGIMLKPRPIFL